MKTFEHNNNTYDVRNGLLYRKYGNVWAYTVYTGDEELRTKATANGWQGNISDDLIDNGSHSYKGKQKQIIMKTLLLKVDYTDSTDKFWLDSSIKNMKVTQKSGETIHDTVKRVVKEVDFMELSYKGKPRNEVFVDAKNGEMRVVGYLYRGKTEIDNKKALFDVWVDIDEIAQVKLPELV